MFSIALLAKLSNILFTVLFTFLPFHDLPSRRLSSRSVKPHFIGHELWMKIKANETLELSKSYSLSDCVICRISPSLLVDHFSGCGQEHRSDMKIKPLAIPHVSCLYDWHFARVLLESYLTQDLTHTIWKNSKTRGSLVWTIFTITTWLAWADDN